MWSALMVTANERVGTLWSRSKLPYLQLRLKFAQDGPSPWPLQHAQEIYIPRSKKNVQGNTKSILCTDSSVQANCPPTTYCSQQMPPANFSCHMLRSCPPKSARIHPQRQTFPPPCCHSSYVTLGRWWMRNWTRKRPQG
jgi:hypothetical protein